VAAADDPVEFGWEPGGPLGGPDRPGIAADARHGGVAVVAAEALQPAGLHPRVIVDECDNVARRRLDTGVPGSADASDVGVGHHRGARAVVDRDPGQQFVIEVDDDDQLIAGPELIQHRLDRGVQQLAPGIGVGADDR